MKKLVFGLSSSSFYWCGAKEERERIFLKLLADIENSVLIATTDITFGVAEMVYKAVGKDRLLLDSGGFTLYKKELTQSPEEFSVSCEKMRRKLLKLCGMVKCHMVFELDNEYFRKDPDLLSPLNYCRQEIKDLTGEYPVPVFKFHQGIQYWKDLCESDIYPKLAIGGLAQTRSWHTKKDELLWMVHYARQCGKHVHLLGSQNVETFKFVKPDSVDYNICQYAINLARVKKEFPELKTFEEIRLQMSLYSFAAAKSRSFLYDTMDAE